MLTLKVKECYTKMTKFILKYTGTNQPDLKKITAILDENQACLLDTSLFPSTALIEIEDSRLPHLKGGLDGEWSIYPEKSYRIPGTRKFIKKSL